MNAHLHHANTSPTAVICDNLERFGGAPARGEPDPRAVWDEKEALTGLDRILDIFVEEVAPDGTQMADERESLLWGFVNTLHMQTVRLDRAVDKLAPKMKELQHAQDGTEINAWELERVIERCQHLGDRRDAFERLRDYAAHVYQSDTGSTWRPRNGSHTSRTSQLTSAAIDARDFQRARREQQNAAHLPQGTLVAVAGSKPVSDAEAIYSALDSVRAKYADMVLVHGGGPGAEMVAARWAESRGVAPGRVQAGLERPRARRAVPPQRRAAEPAAQGRHRLPRFRDLREPAGQGHPARHPGQALQRLIRCACLAGRVATPAMRPALFFGSLRSPTQTAWRPARVGRAARR